MNPLLTGIPNPQMQQYKHLLNTMQGVQNPQSMLQQMASTNPQLKNVMQLVQSSGKSPKDVFYQLAQEKGVDPESILSQLR